MCTLIGTSTNLVLNAQIEADPDAPLKPLGMFTMSLVGIPAAVVGILYLSVATPLAFRVIPEGQNIAGKDEAEDSEAGPVHHAPQESQEGFGSRGSPRYTIGFVQTHCSTLQHIAPHCTILQRTATHRLIYHESLFGTTCRTFAVFDPSFAKCTATHCNTHCITPPNTLQHTATYCNALQRTATHQFVHPASLFGTTCGVLAAFDSSYAKCTATYCNTHTTHYNPLQHTLQHTTYHTATNYNLLQHTAT